MFEIAQAISGASLSDKVANDFLDWPDKDVACRSSVSTVKNHGNIYRYENGGRSVSIRVGSIHSAKGETHRATLVLETYWKKHNIEKLLPWLDVDNNRSRKLSNGVEIQSRRKVHYVAMTRPTHLLCLAMKQESIGDDESVIERLKKRGWDIKMVGDSS